MRLRAKLILSFLGLAVVPLATITVYSYRTSVRALRSVAAQESSAMASDMGSRMESVNRDINRQLERFAAAYEFSQVMKLDKKERAAAMEALSNRLRAQMGENASFLKSLQFTPSAFPPFLPPPPPGPRPTMSSKAGPGDRPKGFTIDFSGESGKPGTSGPENNR